MDVEGGELRHRAEVSEQQDLRERRGCSDLEGEVEELLDARPAAHDHRVARHARPGHRLVAIRGDVDGQAHLLQHEHNRQRGVLIVEQDERAARRPVAGLRRVGHVGIPPTWLSAAPSAASTSGPRGDQRAPAGGCYDAAMWRLLRMHPARLLTTPEARVIERSNGRSVVAIDGLVCAVCAARTRAALSQVRGVSTWWRSTSGAASRRSSTDPRPRTARHPTTPRCSARSREWSWPPACAAG